MVTYKGFGRLSGVHIVYQYGSNVFVLGNMHRTSNTCSIFCMSTCLLVKPICCITRICCPLQTCAKCLRQCKCGITCIYLPLEKNSKNTHEKTKNTHLRLSVANLLQETSGIPCFFLDLCSKCFCFLGLVNAPAKTSRNASSFL